MRWLNLLVVLLFLAGAWLTVHAYRAAGSDAQAELRERDRRFEELAKIEARGWSRQLQEPYADLIAQLQIAAAWHESSGAAPDASNTTPVLLVGLDGELRYGPAPVSPSPSEQDLRLYRVARSGGESFEFGRGQPGDAVDAYTFFLPRMQDPELRARLTLAAGRAALKAGQGRLGHALLASLAGLTELTFTREGLPIPLAAVLTALSLTDPDEAPDRWLEWTHRQLEALDSWSPWVETAWLTYNCGDRAARYSEGRPALEDFVEHHAGHPREGWFLRDDHMIVCQPTSSGLLVAGQIVPTLGLRESAFGGTWVPRSALDDAMPGTVHVPVAPATGVDPLYLEVVNAERTTGRAEIESRRTVRQLQSVVLLVGITVASVLLGIVAHRERRLAELRQRLLANVSHELKTPVTSLRMFAELIRERPEDVDKVARFAGLMRAESVRLGRLIDNVLEASRAWRDEVRVDLRPVDLRPVLGSIAETFEFLAAQQDVAFSIQVPTAGDRETDGSWSLQTDPEAVERITLNLLDNALKYRRATDPRIALSAERANGHLRIVVADNGPGIAAADRERIFEEFYRARYDDYGVQGSGLGLTISRRLARALGGDIRVESTPGEGSTFTLELPVEPAKERA